MGKPIPPLHPKVGPQIFVLEGVKIEGERLVSFSREALEKIWLLLSDLHEFSVESDKK